MLDEKVSSGLSAGAVRLTKLVPAPIMNSQKFRLNGPWVSAWRHTPEVMSQTLNTRWWKKWPAGAYQMASWSSSPGLMPLRPSGVPAWNTAALMIPFWTHGSGWPLKNPTRYTAWNPRVLPRYATPSWAANPMFGSHSPTPTPAAAVLDAFCPFRATRVGEATVTVCTYR